jgi:di/tricarboxylate transporter
MRESFLQIFIISLILLILVAYKTRINIGVLSTGLAFLYGFIILGDDVSVIIQAFPTNIVLMLFLITMLNGYYTETGAVECLVEKMLYAARRHTLLLPWVIWFSCAILSAVCSPNAVILLMGTLTFQILKKADLSPILAVVAISTGSMVGAALPFGQGCLIIKGILEKQPGYENLANQMVTGVWANATVKEILVMVLAMLILCRRRTKQIEMDRPAAFTKDQKRVLVIATFSLIAFSMPFLIGIIAPNNNGISKYFDIKFTCIICIIICSILHPDKSRKIIREHIPWEIIVMISGISMYLGLAKEVGVIDDLSSWLSASVPSQLLPIALVLVAGFMSSFSGAISVVIPMLVPLVGTLSASSGLNPIMLTTCIYIGATSTAISPFSSAGASILGTCPDGDTRSKLFYQQFILLTAIVVFVILMTALGMFNLIQI